MAGISMAILGLSSPAYAVVVFQDNFETAPEVSSAAPLSDSLDADPVATVGTWVMKDRGSGGGDQSEQVTNYGTPGAHSGNNYLRLANTADSQAIANFTAVQTQDVVVDYWINTQQNDARLLMRNSTDGTGNLLSWGATNAGSMTYLDSNGWHVTSVPYQLNVWQHMIATFHFTAGTLDINLDGNIAMGLPMTYDAGPLADFAKVVFVGGGSPPVNVDDIVISVVPEPVGITGLALTALLVKRRRN
jgi:hypothetical protein